MGDGVAGVRLAVGEVDDQASRAWDERWLALVRFAVLLTGDRSRADDLAADALARHLEAARWRTIDDPDAYLRRCVVNAVTGGWRRRRTEARHAHELEAPRVVGDGTGAIDEADRVWRALLTLPERQRAALVLRFYEDRSEQDTAALLGIPVGTVKSTVARGLDRLRALLQDEDGGDGA